MIEIHAHLLPGVDDGPETLEEAIELATAFVEDGVTHVVATPHFFPGRFNNALTPTRGLLENFQRELEVRDIALTISLAGEVRFSEQILRWWESGELPLLGKVDGRDGLLIEMPDGHIPFGMAQLTEWLLARGVVPIIAHPERNRSIRDHGQLGLDLVALGCKFQITAGALLGQFGAKVQKTAKFLIEQDAVFAVASDAHNTTNRAPCLSAARRWLEKNYGPAIAQRITIDNPRQLLSLCTS